MTRFWIAWGLVMASAGAAAAQPAGAVARTAVADDGAADRITLRDGTVIRGLVTSGVGPHNSMEFIVRRDWAARNAAPLLAEWDRAGASAGRKAVETRRARLAAWRRERAQSPDVAPDDRILRWIDGELNRLADVDRATKAPLLGVRMPRSEVRELQRQPALASKTLRQAWLSGIREPESMSMANLTQALEARGFSAESIGRESPPSIDKLLPPANEPEAIWLARRAATEIALDDGLRFLRYQGFVTREPAPGQNPLAGMTPASALMELTRMLNPDAAQGQAGPDPLAERLDAVAARGRIGAVVTRLEIPADLNGATIETTFWVRVPPGRWVAYGTRPYTARADEIRPDQGGDIAQDPQVKGVFSAVESLGLGAIPPELKDRSLRIGAATRKALETARTAFNRDLDGLKLPVLETASSAGSETVPATPAAPAAGPEVRKTPPVPASRRSMLGPQDR